MPVASDGDIVAVNVSEAPCVIDVAETASVVDVAFKSELVVEDVLQPDNKKTEDSRIRTIVAALKTVGAKTRLISFITPSYERLLNQPSFTVLDASGPGINC